MGINELILLAAVIVGPLFLLAIVDVLKSEFKGSDKVAWVIVVMFLPFLGPLLYFFIGGRQKTSNTPANDKQ